MIQRLRQKFILILMGVVTLILLAVFVSMLLSTVGSTRHRSENMLREALAMPTFADGLQPQKKERAKNAFGEEPPNDRMPVLVAQMDADGSILTLNNQLHFIEGAEAQSAVQAALDSGEAMGILKEYDLRWLKSEDGTRIALADISMEQEMMRNLIVNSILIGGAALAAFFLVSVFLSRWAVRPVEVAWERQRQFVADASHELKTPLTVILSNADMLCADNGFGDAKKARRMEHIQAEAVRMKNLVEDMLTLVKSDSAERTTVFSQIDFSDIVTNTVLMYEPIVYDAAQKLEYAVKDGLAVLGDTERLQQLMHILLDNAHKYCPKGGHIKLTLTQADRGRMLLEVSNEGELIPREELDKIFLRFYRRDKARSAHGSFGLGLAIASDIVREHHGKIWAESEAKTGNSFYVSLPLAP